MNSNCTYFDLSHEAKINFNDLDHNGARRDFLPTSSTTSNNIFHVQLSVKSGIRTPIHPFVIQKGNQALLRYNVQQRANIFPSRVLSVVTDKWEQFSGKSVLFLAIMDPFTSLAAWAAPQVRPVKSRPGAQFFPHRNLFNTRARVKRVILQLTFSHFTINVSPFHN